jgi:hypothetical protein
MTPRRPSSMKCTVCVADDITKNTQMEEFTMRVNVTFDNKAGGQS